jgi:hypothetical protein
MHCEFPNARHWPDTTLEHVLAAAQLAMHVLVASWCTWRPGALNGLSPSALANGISLHIFRNS